MNILSDNKFAIMIFQMALTHFSGTGAQAVVPALFNPGAGFGYVPKILLLLI